LLLDISKSFNFFRLLTLAGGGLTEFIAFQHQLNLAN